MKVALVKQRYMPELTWSTHIWDGNASKLLDNYLLRSKWISYIIEDGWDVYVLEDGAYVTQVYQMLKKKHPKGVAALYEAQQATRYEDVSWDRYDAVISIDPIIPKDIINRHKSVLWCYYAGEHQVHGFKQSRKCPQRGYNVFLDHTMGVKERMIKGLPISLSFPPMYSRMGLESLVDVAQKRTCVFLDSRAIRDVSKTAIPKFRKEMAAQLGMDVSFPILWKFASSYEEAAKKRIMSTRAFLQRVSGCKYLLLNRGRAVGQAAPEAAGMGVIVLGSKETYVQLMCHPETRVPPQDYGAAAKMLAKLEANPDLQAQALDYQYKQLARHFLEKPRNQLAQCLRLKKGQS